MPPSKKILCAIVYLCVFTSCSTDTLVHEDTSSTLDPSLNLENNLVLAQEVLDVLNEYRASIGLENLVWHDESEELAVLHSSYMVQQNKVSHDNFFERSTILQEKGASLVSENVAYGYVDATSVLEGWLNSPSHKNAIEGTYTHSGIGIVYTESGVAYFTQLFIK